MNVTLLHGNILDAKVDAMVLPANRELREGSGVSETLFKAAGEKKLKKYCETIAPCEVGTAVPTPGYGLDVDYVIHAVVPRWIDGEHNEYELLSSAYFSALELANEIECNSVAFPLLAAGNNKFDIELAFRIAMKTIADFQGDNLKEVMVVVFGKNTADIVRNMGYSVTVLPKNIKNLEKEKKNIKLKKDLREQNEKQLENMLKKGKELFQDPEKLELAINKGQKYAEIVMNMLKQFP